MFSILSELFFVKACLSSNHHRVKWPTGLVNLGISLVETHIYIIENLFLFTDRFMFGSATTGLLKICQSLYQLRITAFYMRSSLYNIFFHCVACLILRTKAL